MATTVERSALLDLVDTFRAMADPVRLDLLVRIASRDEMPCTTLVEEAHVTASTVSYHVKALKACGLVHVRKEGRNFHYRINDEHVGALVVALVELRLGKNRTLA